MALLDKTLLTAYPSITNRLTTVASRYGISLTEQKLLKLVYYNSMYEFIACDLHDSNIITLMEAAGLFNDTPVCGAYKLKRKKGKTWAILLNENNKEILVGSQERVLNAMEQHQAELHKRHEAKKKAWQAAKWQELNNILSAIKGKDAWI